MAGHALKMSYHSPYVVLSVPRKCVKHWPAHKCSRQVWYPGRVRALLPALRPLPIASPCSPVEPSSPPEVAPEKELSEISCGSKKESKRIEQN